jgi:chorismate--pyruvate lyase
MGKIAFVREVLLYGNDKPVVFARTTIPKKSLRSPLFKLTKIGTKPLGEILFKQKTAKRDRIQIIKLKQKNNNKILWGRISLFYLYHQPFLLTEVFLPNLFKKPQK